MVIQLWVLECTWLQQLRLVCTSKIPYLCSCDAGKKLQVLCNSRFCWHINLIGYSHGLFAEMTLLTGFNAQQLKMLHIGWASTPRVTDLGVNLCSLVVRTPMCTAVQSIASTFVCSLHWDKCDSVTCHPPGDLCCHTKFNILASHLRCVVCTSLVDCNTCGSGSFANTMENRLNSIENSRWFCSVEAEAKPTFGFPHTTTSDSNGGKQTTCWTPDITLLYMFCRSVYAGADKPYLGHKNSTLSAVRCRKDFPDCSVLFRHVWLFV